MKSPYVSELQANQMATINLLVQAKDVRQKKTGDPYLILSLSDRTGEIEGRMWDNAAEAIDTFERDHFLRVKALPQVHHNRLQLVIHKIQKLDEREIDTADFYPSSARPAAEMLAELQAMVGVMQAEPLRQVCEALFADTELCRLLQVAPAAKAVHHAYIGGLLEHVLSVCNLARLVAPRYPGTDLDLVLTGAIFHDIGKVYELTYDRSFGYSDEGQLIGHIVQSAQIFREKARQVEGFPPRLLVLMEHVLLSHHGELAYGSPKIPLLPEALLLHHLDNIDSKMEAMRAQLQRDRSMEGNWTGYNAALDRSVLKKERYLAGASQVTGTQADSFPTSSAPSHPTRDVRDGAPAKPPRPVSASPFAQKLNLALGKE